MHFDASFFVALGFVLFVLLLGYVGVHTKIAGALDGRAKLIADELAEARRSWTFTVAERESLSSPEGRVLTISSIEPRRA